MLRFPEDVLRKRINTFQKKIREMELDAVMLRTLSSYTYFTGIRWLRPALFIPASGDPIALIAKSEEAGYKKKTWIKNIISYVDGGELIVNITKLVRTRKIKRIGMEFGLERDAFILFYEMFKRLNPKTEVVDVSTALSELRMFKDDYELEAIRRAGKKAKKAMEAASAVIKKGSSETEIVAEAYHILYKMGSEEPHVYVNAGPYPRVHSEPHNDTFVQNNTFVTIVIGADHNGYYANMARSFFVGAETSTVKNIIQCINDAYDKALELTKVGTRLRDVIRALDVVYDKYGLINNRLIGYTHGVGLQIEEVPITTIVQAHRAIKVQPRMVLAFIHAPIMYDGLGQIKKEDTFIVNEDGTLENVTS